MKKDSTLSVGVRLLSTVFLLVFFLKQKSSVVGCSWLDETGFCHELYSARGGFEAIYVDVQRPIGFLRFAKNRTCQRERIFGLRAITPLLA
jgi:hypothetical protein